MFSMIYALTLLAGGGPCTPCLEGRWKIVVEQTAERTVTKGSFRVPRGPLGELPQGVCVRINFSIDASGKAAEVVVGRSSGHRALDRAAIHAVERSSFRVQQGGSEAAMVFSVE